MRPLSVLSPVLVISLLLNITPQALAASTAPWTKAGGIPIGDAGTIAFDPSAPATTFAGAAEGGGLIFRSTDAGKTFSTSIVGKIGDSFRCIAVNPGNSKTVIAVSSDNNLRTGAVYRSTNGGTSWAAIAKQPSGLGGCRGLKLDAAGHIVIADDRGGIFYSTNSGGSWSNTLKNVRAYTMASDPGNPATLWAGGYNSDFAGVVWKSSNFGASWTEVKIPVFNANDFPQPVALTIQPGSGKIFVAWVGSDASFNTLGGVVASANGGKSWSNSSVGLPKDIDPGDSIVADPAKSTTVYLTTNGDPYPNNLYQSIDNGATWKAIGTAFGDNNAFIAAARPASAGLPAAVFVGSLYLSTNQGKSWTREGKGIANGTMKAVKDDLLTSTGFYATVGYGVVHSTDGGKSWTVISTWKGATVPDALEVDQKATQHYVYVATLSALQRSADGGKSWTALALPTTKSPITYLMSDPTTAGRLFAIDSNNKIYESTNAGVKWNAGVAIGKAGDLFSAYPATLMVDPGDPKTFYAALSSGLWKSSNLGASWTKSTLPQKGQPISIAAVTGSQSPCQLCVLSLDFNTGIYALQGAATGGKSWSNIPLPPNGSSYERSLLGTTGSDLFVYGSDQRVLLKHPGGVGSWITIDAALTSLMVRPTAMATRNTIFLSDYTGSTYMAPLKNFAITVPGDAPAP
jgi:photosystem II stability/assembly factor-like uncharacterized protein